MRKCSLLLVARNAMRFTAGVGFLGVCQMRTAKRGRAERELKEQKLIQEEADQEAGPFWVIETPVL